jgi:hypothetical protein
MATFRPRLIRDASLSSQEDSKDEAGVEAVYQEEETTTVPDGCGRLAKAESE